MSAGRSAVGGCLALVLVTWTLAAPAGSHGADRVEHPTRVEQDGIEVATALAPRPALFGDTVRATVDVAFDPRRIDEASVRVRPDFTPWQVTAPAERTRTRVGEAVHLRIVYRLRCVVGPCLPGGSTAAVELAPVRVAFSRAGEDGSRLGVARAGWPLLVTYSRYAASRIDLTPTAPYQADLASLPEVSFRARPALLAGGLLGAAAILAVGGVALLVAARPRRAPAPAPEPAPAPAVSPLEQALALLEASSLAEGAGERRRALELVAEELERWGDAELSGAAKVLAWSAGAPAHEQTAALAARVRDELEQALLAQAELERNGGSGAA